MKTHTLTNPNAATFGKSNDDAAIRENNFMSNPSNTSLV